MRGGHVVSRHHVSGLHGEEFCHSEGRTISVGGDDARGVVSEVACNHEANGVHAGHVDTQKVVEPVGEVVVVGQVGVCAATVGLETRSDSGVHGPVSDEGRVEIRCSSLCIHGEIAIRVGSSHHRGVRGVSHHVGEHHLRCAKTHEGYRTKRRHQRDVEVRIGWMRCVRHGVVEATIGKARKRVHGVVKGVIVVHHHDAHAGWGLC